MEALEVNKLFAATLMHRFAARLSIRLHRRRDAGELGRHPIIIKARRHSRHREEVRILAHSPNLALRNTMVKNPPPPQKKTPAR